MNYILLTVSVFLGTGKNIISKYASKGFSRPEDIFKINIITSLIGICVFRLNFEIINNPIALILGIAYGALILLSQMLFIKAVEYSETAVCSLIYSMGFIIPTLFSVIAFKEPFGLQKAIALILMLVSFWCVSNVGVKGNSKLYFAFAAMLSSGTIGVIQKLIAKSESNIPIPDYLGLAFTVMLTLSVVGLFFTKSKKTFLAKHNIKRFAVLSFLMGVCVVFVNRINTDLAGRMQGVIFFTCVNGGTVILSALLSKILFKEKLRSIQTLGIAVGVFAIIIMVI